MQNLSGRLRTLFKKFRATKFRSMEIDDAEMSIKAVKKSGATVVACNTPIVKSVNDSVSVDEAGHPTVRKPSIASVQEDAVLEARAVTPHTLRSPRVGHFHFTDKKKLPEAVLVEGTPIADGDIIGYIESMNVLYEVKADMGGVVSAALIEDGEAVEYGQPLASFDETAVASESDAKE